jgi:hypothetical protein
VPFYTWLDLQADIRRQPTWTRVTHDVSGFALPEAITPWGVRSRSRSTARRSAIARRRTSNWRSRSAPLSTGDYAVATRRRKTFGCVNRALQPFGTTGAATRPADRDWPPGGPAGTTRAS